MPPAPTEPTDAKPPDYPQRPPRIDKGSIRLTDRDLRCVRWIGEQYTVRFDTLQKLLGREPQQDHSAVPVHGVLSERNTRRAIRRWFDEDLVVYKKILFAEPGYVWLTALGLKAAHLDYKPYQPAVASLPHSHVLNELRLKLEGRYQARLTWVAERELRRGHERLDKDKRRGWHLPDAVVTLDQKAIAIEVELTQKTDRRLTETVERLTQQYQGVWYFVSDDVREAVVKAIGTRTQIFRVYPLAEVLT